jgi:lipoyl(octanoyl) transferase
MAETLWVCNVGTIDYRSGLELQEALRTARQQELIPDTLLLLEHTPALYTRGRRSVPGELTMGEAWYAERGIEIIQTKRGGKVTYHGPGQLVGYGIVRIDDTVGYVRLMENAIADALGSSAGIAARGRPEDGFDYTGVWVGERKIASIGVHVSRGVAAHGFAVNVENDMRPFNWVIACGLPEVTMTSIAAEQGDPGNAPAAVPAIPEGLFVAAHTGNVPITTTTPTTTERFVRFRAAMATSFAARMGAADGEARAIEAVSVEQVRDAAAAAQAASAEPATSEPTAAPITTPAT